MIESTPLHGGRRSSSPEASAAMLDEEVTNCCTSSAINTLSKNEKLSTSIHSDRQNKKKIDLMDYTFTPVSYKSTPDHIRSLKNMSLMTPIGDLLVPKIPPLTHDEIYHILQFVGPVNEILSLRLVSTEFSKACINLNHRWRHHFDDLVVKFLQVKRLHTKNTLTISHQSLRSDLIQSYTNRGKDLLNLNHTQPLASSPKPSSQPSTSIFSIKLPPTVIYNESSNNSSLTHSQDIFDTINSLPSRTADTNQSSSNPCSPSSPRTPNSSVRKQPFSPRSCERTRSGSTSSLFNFSKAPSPSSRLLASYPGVQKVSSSPRSSYLGNNSLGISTKSSANHQSECSSFYWLVGLFAHGEYTRFIQWINDATSTDTTLTNPISPSLLQIAAIPNCIAAELQSKKGNSY